MNILFLMPESDPTFGNWMPNMIDSLGDDLKAIIVDTKKDSNRWIQKIPLYAIKNRPLSLYYISRFSEIFFYKRKLTPIYFNRLIVSAIRKHAITHIICQYGTYAVKFMDIWEKVDLPLFIHFHGYDATFDMRSMIEPNTRIHNTNYKNKLLELERRALFITPCKFTKSLLIDAGFIDERIFVKPLGVPLPQKRKIHKAKDNLRILHLGRLIDCKSPDRTIKAFELSKNMGLSGELIVGGDGPLKTYCELLRRRSQHSESIHILGQVNREYVSDLLLSCDIFTQHNVTGELSLQTESFGTGLVEAMASGLPVVGTRSGGVMESVIDGITGYLNEPFDIEGQSNAFLKLANDPDLRQKMGDAGRERVAKHYSPEQEARKLRTIMNVSDTRLLN